MCQIFSGWYLKTGEVVTDEASDSHNDLAEFYNIKDTGKSAVAFEYIPPKDHLKDIADLSQWKLRTDTDIPPSWWNEDRQADARRQMERIVRARIVSEDATTLLGGAWIVLPGVTVRRLVGRCAILLGTVNEVCGNGTVNEVRDNGTVNKVWDNGTVNVVWDNGTVNKVRDNGKIIRDLRKKTTAPASK